MKKVEYGLRAVVVCISLLYAAPALAQDDTLESRGFSRGGYLAPMLKLGPINNELAVIMGLRGGWILNPIAIGVGGYASVSNIKMADAEGAFQSQYIDFAYWGIEMEYIHKTEKLVHWTAYVIIGGGTVDIVEYNPDRTVDTEDVFIIEPNLEVDLNITTATRLGLGASYRQVFGLELDGLRANDLSGGSVFVIAKFGSF